MGSGLILLVIVGAWLAVLVPMVLRSHESSRSLGTAEKFQDAMRVLSRRDATPGAPGASGASVASGARVVRRGAAPAPAAPSPVSPSPVAAGPAPRAASRRVDPARVAASRAALAARRRRVLAGLALLALATLFGGLVGPSWLLAVHALVDLLLVAYVGHLRHQQVLRAEREWRGALAERAPAEQAPAERARARRRPVVDELELDETPAVPARAVRPPARRAAATTALTTAATTAAVRVAAPARIAGIPDTMPPRPAPLEAPVRGAQGEPWAPVPVPLPGYVTAPTAPRRVLDLTRPGEWSDGVAAAERDLGIDDPGPELNEILERRRAAGDW